MDYYIKYLKPEGNISELIRKALDDWLLRFNPNVLINFLLKTLKKK